MQNIKEHYRHHWVAQLTDLRCDVAHGPKYSRDANKTCANLIEVGMTWVILRRIRSDGGICSRICPLVSSCDVCKRR